MNLPERHETWVQSLGLEDPLEKEMATHFSIRAWRIPWTEEPGRLLSMVGCKESDATEWLILSFTFTFFHCIIPLLNLTGHICTDRISKCFVFWVMRVGTLTHILEGHNSAYNTKSSHEYLQVLRQYNISNPSKSSRCEQTFTFLEKN